MRILISNDDGISSKGIQYLTKYMKEIGDVTVVAPISEQSAIGHAITMKIPLRIHEYFRDGEKFGYAIDGTPADCIKIGITKIIKQKPDLVISGINNGSNTAINIIYSGTVSAAREAAIMNVPAISISVTDHNAINYDYAGKIAQMLAKKVYENGLPQDTVLNVNVPDLPEERIKGIVITRQGKSKWDDTYEERIDPYGKNYFWLTGNLMEVDNALDIDQFATKNNYVSITPIHFDLTDYKTLDLIKSWDIEKHF